MLNSFYFYLLCFAIQQISAENLHPKVFNGKMIRPHNHKYLVMLHIGASNRHGYDIMTTCSGSIISQTWIISAAHCFMHDAIKQVEVLNLDTFGYPRLIAHGSEFIVNPFYRHLKIHQVDVENDLALLETADRIMFDGLTKPIRLSQTRPNIGQQVILVGYGNSEEDDQKPRKGSTYLTKCSHPGAMFLCTSSIIKVGGGDSGGPLVYKGKLVGVISARKCKDDDPVLQECESQFVDITQHLRWIKYVTGI